MTYNEYVTELTFLLFLKMVQETVARTASPTATDWDELAKREGFEQLEFYRRLMLDLGRYQHRPRTRPSCAIFSDASTKLPQAR